MKPFVWGDFYRKALRNGADHGAAAYAADRAEARAKKRGANPSPVSPSKPARKRMEAKRGRG